LSRALPRRPRRDGAIVELRVDRSSVEGWRLSRALPRTPRRDGAIVELTVDRSSVEGWRLSRALPRRPRRDGAVVELTVDRTVLILCFIATNIRNTRASTHMYTYIHTHTFRE
jgi:hypothetical protein